MKWGVILQMGYGLAMERDGERERERERICKWQHYRTDGTYIVLQGLLKIVKVLVTTVDAQWEGMGGVGSARYKPALLPPCPTIQGLSYSN